MSCCVAGMVSWVVGCQAVCVLSPCLAGLGLVGLVAVVSGSGGVLC